MERAQSVNLTREDEFGNGSYADRFLRIDKSRNRADQPYSRRGRIVTMPGHSVSSNTKPIMMMRYGNVTRAI